MLNSQCPTTGSPTILRRKVLRKRPYLTKELCIREVEAPIRFERQEGNRYRFWATIPELEGKALRVVTLEDTSPAINLDVGGSGPSTARADRVRKPNGGGSPSTSHGSRPRHN